MIFSKWLFRGLKALAELVVADLHPLDVVLDVLREEERSFKQVPEDAVFGPGGRESGGENIPVSSMTCISHHFWTSITFHS